MTWADLDYGYKKKITIDNIKVAANHTDFPVMVSVTDADLADTGNGGHVESSSGYDIVFYNSAEDTLLKHEIERYVNTSGLLVFWVKIPSILGASDTDFYIYYGKADVVVDPSSTDTWDANFKAVHHLAGANAAACDDSTSNGNDITLEGGSPDYQQAGISNGYAVQLLRASSEYLGMADNATLDLVTGKCLEIWVKYGTWNNEETMKLFEKWWDDSNRAYYLNTAKDSEGATVIDFGIERATPREDDHTVMAVALATGTWHYIVGDWQKDVNSGNIYVYKDTTSETDVAATGNSRINNEDLSLGCDTQVASPRNFFDGLMSEVRISDISRGSDWLETTYNSISNPAAFMSFGAEEEAPAGVEHTHFSTDTLAMSDSLAALKVLHHSAADTLTISDALGVVAEFKVALADTLNISDLLSVAATYNVALADTLDINDSLSTAAQYVVALADTLEMSDALVVVLVVAELKKRGHIYGLKPARVVKAGRIGI